MEERTTQSSLAEKMNQLYAEREEQYRRREKLFDERATYGYSSIASINRFFSASLNTYSSAA